MILHLYFFINLGSISTKKFFCCSLIQKDNQCITFKYNSLRVYIVVYFFYLINCSYDCPFEPLCNSVQFSLQLQR